MRNTEHGFRKGFSCATNLLVFLENATENVDARHNIDTVYFDLAKAFDLILSRTSDFFPS